MIDQQTLKIFVSYNPETGEFTRLKGTGKGAAAGTVSAGALDSSTGYRKLCVAGKPYYAHRLAWLYMTGSWPEDQIDHVNHRRDDNRFCNLRPATNAQNNQRTKARSDSKTGVLGVSWHKKANKYMAQIRHLGNTIYLGLHESVDAAVAARKAAEVRYHSHHRSAT
ncbi:MAG: hypothetical protein RL758_220 [Pseudomonadota bacterium]|jgi:hypothetical protein